MSDKKILIFGLNHFSEMLKEYLEEDGECVEAFLVDRAYANGIEKFCGKPVCFFENIEDRFSPDQYCVMFALGYHKMNALRAEKQRQCHKLGYDICGYRHPTALILTDDIGKGNIFLENVTVGKHVKIGDGNIFYPCAHIAHHTSIMDFNFFAISCAVAGSVKIGNGCFLGNNCTIRNGIKIHDNTLVGAGCYMSKSTEYGGGVFVPERSLQLEGKDSFQIL